MTTWDQTEADQLLDHLTDTIDLDSGLAEAMTDPDRPVEWDDDDHDRDTPWTT